MKGGQLKILKQNEIEEIHQRALDVLQQVGCFMDHEGGFAIFEKHGAIVDHSTQIVKIPRNLVEEALRLSPSSSGFRAPPKNSKKTLDKSKI